MNGTATRIRILAAVAAAIILICSCTDPSSGRSAATDQTDAVDTLDLRFTDVSKESGLVAIGSPTELKYGETMSSGIAVADVDADGFDDIFFPRPGLPNVLYMNNGDGTFTDRSEESGLAQEEPTYGSSTGVFFDANNDGSLDLFVTGFGRGESRMYLNNGDGTFVDRTLESGISLPPLSDDGGSAQMHGSSVADVNGDGLLDLLVLHWHTAWMGTNELAEHARSEGVDDVHQLDACKISELADSAPSLDQADVDGESPSAQDLASRSRLFMNNGDGTFSDGTSQMGLDFSTVIAFTATFNDFDGDGWVDLAVTGDGCSSRLWRNVTGERFEDVTKAAGVGTDENGMGSVFKDLTGDGLPDWLISSISYGNPKDKCIVSGGLVGCSGNRFYVNDGNGTFSDRTSESGLRDGGWGWGLAAENFANTDGTQVVMTNGFADRRTEDADPDETQSGYPKFVKTFAKDTTRFWIQDSKGSFQDVAERVGISDDGVAHGLVPFDYNNDGRLDILIAQAGGPPVLYRNDGRAQRSWLSIRLDDPSSPGNRWGDGAKVEVFAERESEPRVGWIFTSGSYESQKPPEFHLGLGDRNKPVHHIVVHWPHGGEPQRVDGVKLNQRLVITRGDG